VEIMLSSPYLSELIEKGEVDQLKDAMERESADGMQTFDDALYDLYQRKLISEEVALQNADSRNNMGLKIRLGDGANISDIDGDLLGDEYSVK